jgi:hypothetical protein
MMRRTRFTEEQIIGILKEAVGRQTERNRAASCRAGNAGRFGTTVWRALLQLRRIRNSAKLAGIASQSQICLPWRDG